MKFGVVGRTTDGFFRYQGWPTVAKDEKGVLYAAAPLLKRAFPCSSTSRL